MLTINSINHLYQHYINTIKYNQHNIKPLMFWAQHRFWRPEVMWISRPSRGQMDDTKPPWSAGASVFYRREEKAETLGKRSGEWLVNGWWIVFSSARVRKFAKYCLNEVSRSRQIFGNGRWMDVCASSFQWKMEKIAADPRGTGSTPTWLTWPKIVSLFPPEGSVFIGWGVEILLESEHIYIICVCVCVYVWISFIHILSR